MPAAEMIAAVEAVLVKHDEDLRREPNLTSSTSNTSAPTPATAGPKPLPVKTDAIKRPNGEMYVPRKLKMGGTDVAFIQRAYENRMPVLLYGPPGTGKTALLEAALPGLITMMGTSETETSDFIGTWVQNPDGLYEWVDGPLLQAMENGLPLLIDEIALIDARTMSVVYSVMDGRDELPVTANPARGVAKVKDGFVVYGACNPDVPGAIMSDALLSRFKVHISVNTDWSLAIKLGISAKIITVAKNLAIQAESGGVVAPPQLRELLTFQQCAAVYGEEVAISNFIAQSRPEDRTAFASAIASVYGHDHKPLTF